MRSRTPLPILLVLLYASHGMTGSGGLNCTQREGTSLTMLMDVSFTFRYSTYMGSILNRLSLRFPCVTRQYASVILDFAETNIAITNDPSEFMQSIQRNYGDDLSLYQYYFNHSKICNQSLLYGLKRALEISPAESIIVVQTYGSMVDYNDTRLWSEVYNLLEEKKCHVYFISYSWWWNCAIRPSPQDKFREISSLSGGRMINLEYVDYYKLLMSFQFLLCKPLNSSVSILNITTNVTDKYNKVFNVPSSFTYLLITGNELFTLNFTDPKGNLFTFRKNPRYYLCENYYHYTYYYYNFYYYYYDYILPSSHLVKSPAVGSWSLNAEGKRSLSVQVLGITGLNKPGSCSDSDCHPNATCSEFGGYGECTCKEGFAGDGTSCDDIDECQDDYSHSCYDYGGYCVNTIGSYTCNCYSGYQYDTEFGCVDIDECADRSLHDCDPVATCTNNYGSYMCTCPYGYYGDGKHCEINECQQGNPCNYNEDCIKYIGSHSCIDPCYNHTVLNEPWRSTANTYSNINLYYWYHCDYGLSGWYRFKGEYDQQIPEHCVPLYSCGTSIPIWMKGSHPTLSDGVVNRTACSNTIDGCCAQSYNISVRMCPGGFYVYKLQSTPNCNFAYCTESANNCSGVDCAPDEECRVMNGVQGCYCKDSSYITDGIKPGNLADYITPRVTCGLGNIEVRFSKCLLEKLGYDTSSIHLKDNNCRGVTEKSDKSYVTLVMRPAPGSCGGYISNKVSDTTYTNTVYLASSSDGVIIRDEYPIDFHCSYPLNMEISLLTAISTNVSSATINVAGTANFSITMGLFQDSGYTTLYTSSEVWLDSTSILYVGVVVIGGSGSSQFVVIMNNCYATPTADSSFGPRYDIIKDRCPNKNDPTLSVPENGVSLKGRFSLQVFKFLGGFNQIYLHCQVGLCDTSRYDCSARCPSVRSAFDGNTDLKMMTFGPIRQKAAQTSLSSGGGSALPTAKLFISAIALLFLLY